MFVLVRAGIAQQKISRSSSGDLLCNLLDGGCADRFNRLLWHRHTNKQTRISRAGGATHGAGAAARSRSALFVRDEIHSAPDAAAATFKNGCPSLAQAFDAAISSSGGRGQSTKTTGEEEILFLGAAPAAAAAAH